MRVTQIYNQQRSIGGGEENVVLQTTEWLRETGIWTDLLLRSSRSIEGSFGKKIKAAVTGIYNPEAYRFIRDYIVKNHPSVVHAHNLFPQWSPSIFLACCNAGIPTLFTIHCQVLTCPTWYHLFKSKVCEKCLESGEYWCVPQNCRGNYAESIVYALRSFIVRKHGLFRTAVTRIIAPSEFMRQRLISVGFSAEQIQTIWNAVPIPEQTAEPQRGKYVAFAGRLSQEKGVEGLLKVARALPKVPFRLAGTGPMEGKWRQHSPPNVNFLGFLEKNDLAQFYRSARLLVVPSISYETFSITAAEGMAYGLPIAASRIGALTELISEGETGYLVEPGNTEELTKVIGKLWRDPLRCREMGLAGREWVKYNLNKETYISKLSMAYRDAKYLATVQRKNNQV